MKLVYLDSKPMNDLNLDNNHLTAYDPKLHKWLDERTPGWDNSQTPCPVAQNTVQFTAAAYNRNENGKTVTLTVSRVGDGAVSVNCKSSDASATAG
ncbi:hypothetical protein THIOM_000528, partial [Candidatus Thiomargarita nelsonii]